MTTGFGGDMIECRAAGVRTYSARFCAKIPASRPGSYGPLRHQSLTCKGEVAHEADGTTVGCGPQPRPNLLSPECPTRGLLQGGKPTGESAPQSNSDSAARRRKAKRVSESELHGAVNPNLAALLSRGSESSRVVGPPARVVHGDRQARRSLSGTRLRRMWNHQNWDMLFVAP